MRRTTSRADGTAKTDKGEAWDCWAKQKRSRSTGACASTSHPSLLPTCMMGHMYAVKHLQGASASSRSNRQTYETKGEGGRLKMHKSAERRKSLVEVQLVAFLL